MKVKNISLHELRKKYEDSEEFIIRIRDSIKEKGSNKKDLVYYNGIKAFEISQNKDANIALSDKVYKINQANLLDAREKSYNLIDAITALRNELKEYFTFKLESVTLKPAKSTYNNDKEKVRKSLENLFNELEPYLQYFDKFNVEDIMKMFNKNENYTINIKDNNGKLTNADITTIEYYFLYYTILENEKATKRTGFAKPKVKISFVGKKEIMKEDLENFDKKVKNSINQYLKYVGKKEKRYQHLFMINKNLYKRVNEKMLPFEEEYCTDESDSGKKDRGRIDCSFVNIEGNCLKDIYLKDIYLIELKVNENVVDGENGIHKHFIDIQNMLKNKETFIELVKKRIDYRFNYDTLEKENKIDLKCKNAKIHFDTIIAITNEESRDKVFEKLKHLNNVMEVKKDVNSGKLPKGSLPIYEHLKFLNENQVSASIYIDPNYNEENDNVPELEKLKIMKDEIKIEKKI